MVFRLTRARLKAERLLLLFALVLLMAYISFCASFIRISTDLFSYNQFDYRYHKNMNAYSETGFANVEVDPISIAITNGVDPRDLPEKADLHDVYEAVIRKNRGFLYDYIQGAGMLGAFPYLDGMAMLLLCPLFRKRRIGQYLSAGYSRRQVFLPITLTYFAFAVLMWALASLIWLSRFHIPFGAFWENQLAWLGFTLLFGALAYLAAMLLPRPAVAFFASLGVWILLLLCIKYVSKWVVIGAGLVILAAVIVLPWRHFRKRGFAA